jgi:predicted nucleic acid-binding protein
VVARLETGEIAPDAIDDFISRGRYLAACTPQLLEVMFSTRSAREWDEEYSTNWAFFRVLHPTTETHSIALEIQRRLWASGRVRAAGTVDVLTAAVAVQHDAIVVHRDSDYERIAEVAPEFRQVRV